MNAPIWEGEEGLGSQARSWSLHTLFSSLLPSPRVLSYLGMLFEMSFSYALDTDFPRNFWTTPLFPTIAGSSTLEMTSVLTLYTKRGSSSMDSQILSGIKSLKPRTLQIRDVLLQLFRVPLRLWQKQGQLRMMYM